MTHVYQDWFLHKTRLWTAPDRRAEFLTKLQELKNTAYTVHTVSYITDQRVLSENCDLSSKPKELRLLFQEPRSQHLMYAVLGSRPSISAALEPVLWLLKWTACAYSGCSYIHHCVKVWKDQREKLERGTNLAVGHVELGGELLSQAVQLLPQTVLLLLQWTALLLELLLNFLMRNNTTPRWENGLRSAFWRSTKVYEGSENPPKQTWDITAFYITRQMTY